jgi:hypothetical protein
MQQVRFLPSWGQSPEGCGKFRISIQTALKFPRYIKLRHGFSSSFEACGQAKLAQRGKQSAPALFIDVNFGDEWILFSHDDLRISRRKYVYELR